MNHNLHPNFIKASNLMFVSAIFGIVNLFLIPNTFASAKNTTIAVTTLLILAIISYIVRLGKNWMKYLLLVLMILGLLGMPFITILRSNLLLGLINIIQTVLQFWALILLFKVPKQDPIAVE